MENRSNPNLGYQTTFDSNSERPDFGSNQRFPRDPNAPSSGFEQQSNEQLSSDSGIEEVPHSLMGTTIGRSQRPNGQ